MRGEPYKARAGDWAVRITPAYAGRTAATRWASPRAWDHPRVCGENRRGRSVMFAWLGSPPRMRGEPDAGAAGSVDVGITPAYAGRTQTRGSGGPARKDHPRVCGENGLGAQRGVQIGGSPPRMRGEPLGWPMA